jgi:hypothetical protein
MRWKSQKLIKADLGRLRVRRKFLLWPRKFGRTWHWLQYVNVVEKVMQIDVGGSMEWGKYAYEWRILGLNEPIQEE